MSTRTNIIDYWLVTVWTRERGFEDVRVYGTEAKNATEAKKQARRYGKIINCLTMYRHDD